MLDDIRHAEAESGEEPTAKRRKKTSVLSKVADRIRGLVGRTNKAQRLKEFETKLHSGKITVADIPKMFPENSELLVQIVKGPIGTKGARLSTNITIPGRYLVLLPYSDHIGLSSRIDDRKERDRLRKILAKLDVPEGMGLIFLGGKQALEAEGEKRFDQEKVIRFATEHGLAFFDTARKVCRTKDNASDQFLEIQEPTDVGSLLSHIPSCTQVVTTGGKASEELFVQTDADAIPAVGTCTICHIGPREIRWWRMPSTSRAYPMKIERKAEHYRMIFQNEDFPKVDSAI